MSPRFSISPEQWSSLGRQCIKYTAPLMLVFLLSIQQGTPVKEALYVVYAGALQLAINFLSKYVTETK